MRRNIVTHQWNYSTLLQSRWSWTCLMRDDWSWRRLMWDDWTWQRLNRDEWLLKASHTVNEGLWRLYVNSTKEYWSHLRGKIDETDNCSSPPGSQDFLWDDYIRSRPYFSNTTPLLSVLDELDLARPAGLRWLGLWDSFSFCPWDEPAHLENLNLGET